MRKEKGNSADIFQELFERYPKLCACQVDLEKAYHIIRKSFSNGGQLLVAGNGGSAADAEHIVGELMKSFRFHRPINSQLAAGLETQFGEKGYILAGQLEGALPAIPLTSMPALTTAFANDVDASVDFAQKLCGYGRKGDVFLGITTSGNSTNILSAMMVARVAGIHSVALTGRGGGKCAGLADVVIRVPEDETYSIQEHHLPIYHALCAMLEADFFDENIGSR